MEPVVTSAARTGRVWLRRWWDSPARDVAFAIVMAALLVSGSYGEAHPSNPGHKVVSSHPVPATPTAAYLLVAAACLALAWRRRWPAAVLVVSTVAVAVYSLLGYVNGAALLAPYAALYTFASRVSARRALAWGLGMLIVLMAATASANPFSVTGGGFDIMPFLAAAACFAGIAVNSRRAYIDSVRVRAEDDAQRRVNDERLRIARELHDVVAHTMATITVQASAASQLLRDRPEQAAESLAAIRAAGKEGLRELRSILDVLRSVGEGPAPPDGPARRDNLMTRRDPTQPVPGLARLDALAERVRQAGLPVTVTVTGEPLPLPAVTDVSAFRIIQEALTNAIRHAGPATAAVTVRYGRDDLQIEITDTGTGGTIRSGKPGKPEAAGGPGSEGGHGLRGMRERSAAAGGTIEIGPIEPHGFRVAASFPASVPEIAVGEALR
jgi:signal transduction histidine kinase